MNSPGRLTLPGRGTRSPSRRWDHRSGGPYGPRAGSLNSNSRPDGPTIQPEHRQKRGCHGVPRPTNTPTCKKPLESKNISTRNTKTLNRRLAAPRPTSKQRPQATTVTDRRRPRARRSPSRDKRHGPTWDGFKPPDCHPATTLMLLYLACLLPESQPTQLSERAQPEPRLRAPHAACEGPPMHSHRGPLPAAKQPRDYWVQLKGVSRPSTSPSATPCGLPHAERSS